MKRIIAAILAAIMVLSLAACASNPKEDTPKTSDTATGQDAAAPSTSTDEENRTTGISADEDYLTPASVETENDSRTLILGMITMDMKNSYFEASDKGCQEFADRYGHQVTFFDGNGSAMKQIDALESCISMGVDAIDIRVVDTASAADYIRDITENRGIELSCYPAIAGRTCGNQYEDYDIGTQQGEHAAQWIRDHFESDDIEVAFLTQPQANAVMDRRNGFHDKLLELCPNVKIVAEMEGYNAEDACAVTESILQAHPNVKMILCVNDTGALGALQAVEGLGMATDDFYISGSDGDKAALQKIAEGSCIRASVCSELLLEELGYGIMLNVSQAALGREYLEVFPVRNLLVDQSNVEEYMQKTPDYDNLEKIIAGYYEEAGKTLVLPERVK